MSLAVVARLPQLDQKDKSLFGIGTTASLGAKSYLEDDTTSTVLRVLEYSVRSYSVLSTVVLEYVATVRTPYSVA